jgi:hypothetical protein
MIGCIAMNRKQRLIAVTASIVAIMLFLWPSCKHNQLGGWEQHRFVFDLGDYRSITGNDIFEALRESC